MIDTLAAERDAARESLGYVQAETDAMYRRVVMLEAEVEQLRLAAEAWRTLEAARKEERTGTDENEHAEYWVHILARNAARAADRARAAKEAKA